MIIVILLLNVVGSRGKYPFIFRCVFPQDMFIGFGGNVIREKVKSQAPWFVTSFQELLQEQQPPHSVNGLESHFNGEVNGTENHVFGNRN